MMRRVVIILGRQGKAITGMFVDGVLESMLSTLPPQPMAGGGEPTGLLAAWVIVPGEDVVQHAIEIPALNEKKALAAVPFLLEDAVAGDVSDLHFATGTAATGRRFAAVMSRSLMQSYLDQLAAHGVVAEVVTPDYLVTGRQGVASITVSEDRAVVSLPDESGLTIEMGLLRQTLLPLLRTSQISELQLAADPNHARTVAAVLPDFNIRTVPLPAARHMLQTIHDRLATRVALNLRQGAFAIKRQWAFNAKPLKRAAALAAAFLVLLTVQTIASGMRSSVEATRALAAADTVARNVLPAGARLVNARAQTKTLAASLKAGSADAFLVMSESLAQALTTVSGGYVQSMQYDGVQQTLSVAIVVPSYDAMADLRTQLSGRGLAIDDRGARQSGEAVIGDLVMRQP
jgi:general secretion pathway protein L